MDDDFATIDDIVGAQNISELEWKRLHDQFYDAGYRGGITAGKESTLQAGFDEGYLKYGSPGGRELGLARGRANVLLNHFCQRDPSLAQEAQEIVKGLDGIRIDHVCLQDTEAEQHFQDEHEDFERQVNITDSLDKAFSGSLGVKDNAKWDELRQRLSQLVQHISSS